MPVLIQHQNDLVVNKYQIPQSGLTIGRSVKNDIFLDDPSASQQHAKIEVKELKDGTFIYFVVDQASTNHTYVNQQAITEHLLSDLDVIEIGLTHFKYIDENKESLAATKQFKKSWIPGILVLKE
jgi:pSer/pThr/pTyr-binding forkhead associated (FHA) protein